VAKWLIMNSSDTHHQRGPFQEESWSDIYKSLKNQEGALNDKDLRKFALAAYLIGKDRKSIDILNHLHHQYLEKKEIKHAIRSAFWIGFLLMFKGERARGSGWFSRAHRLIDEHEYEGSENELLLIPTGLGELGAGNAEKAYNIFKKAHEAGTGYNDPDLSILSLLGLGQALIQKGEISPGTSLLDESMVMIEIADISPLVIGIVYCAVIETCQLIFDIGRAQEWTKVLSQWCESQPDLVPFRGQCLIRRSQIRHLHGEWPEALDEMHRACQLLSKPPGEPAAGEANYQLAEIFRLKGDLKHAELLFREAHKWGRNPQPGMALLRLMQNEKEKALQNIQTSLNETKNPLHRIKLLPAYIEILLAHEKLEDTRRVVNELTIAAEKYDAIYLSATVAYCQGCLLLKEGDTTKAINSFQQSLNLYKKINAPYEIAYARFQLGIAYRDKGDHDSSELEFATAQWIFQELKATPDLKKVEAYIDKKKESKRHGLTLRELQVLQLVGEGSTNKICSNKLFISERTVERHLSNIFNKLEVNSRTEAIAFAFKHRML
jgi:ATP/maltotriose-dependent transcriptional regulator MalT